jgi:hypothetical protein
MDCVNFAVSRKAAKGRSVRRVGGGATKRIARQRESQEKKGMFDDGGAA